MAWFILATILLSSAGISAVAKEPTTRPPLSINISSFDNGIFRPSALTPGTATTLESLVQSLPGLYNSTWRQSIRGLITNNSNSLDGSWIESIDVSLYPRVLGQILSDYVYQTDLEASSNLQGFHQMFPISDPVSQKFTKLNDSLFVGFGFSGYYVKGGEEAFLRSADTYVKRLAQLSPQIVEALSKQLPGRALFGLDIIVLDENVVHLALFETDNGVSVAYSHYFGVSNLDPVASQSAANSAASMSPYIVSVLLISAGAALSLALFVMKRRSG